MKFKCPGNAGHSRRIFPRRGTLQGHAASPEVFVAVLSDALEVEYDANHEISQMEKELEDMKK